MEILHLKNTIPENEKFTRRAQHQFWDANKKITEFKDRPIDVI